MPRPGRTVEIDLPALNKADDLVAACAAVIEFRCSHTPVLIDD